MHESAKNSVDPRNDAKDLSIAMYISERRATLFRGPRVAPRRKNCWCTPRKVGSMNSAKSVDNPTLKMDSKRQKKDRRKKVPKVSKKLRRIDVLAQPKSQNQQKHSSSVPHPPQKIRYSKLSTTAEKQSRKSLSGRNSKKLSKVTLSKKLQRRLISLVAKKIKELAHSGKVS